MPRKAEGPRPLTDAERQARQRQRKATRESAMRKALEKIIKATTVREAREIAASALES